VPPTTRLSARRRGTRRSRRWSRRASRPALRDRRDSSDIAASFEGPLWVVAGESDPFLSLEEAERIASAARAGRLEVFQGTGHFPNLEQSERFNQLLREFLAAVR
jgi:pimeloyl-ACP methyl ester carboxylesterase